MKKNNIKVSVVVPVYNVEKYLPQCLDSLVHQSLKDIEILVINDGSPDNSQLIIDEYMRKYPNKIKSYTKENGGLSDARNYGIKRAQGEYIGFVDSDDYVETNMLEEMYSKAVDQDCDVVVCYINQLKEDKTKIMPLHYLRAFGGSVEENPEVLFACKSYAFNKLYRRKLFIDNDLYFPVGQVFEDSAIVYNILLMANKIELVDKALCNYRTDRTDSITNSMNMGLFDIFKSCDSIIDFYKSKGVFDVAYEVLENICRMHIFARINTLKNSTDRKFQNQFFDSAYEYLDNHFPNWRKNRYYQYSYKNLIKKRTQKKFTKAKMHKTKLKMYFIIPMCFRRALMKIFWRKKKKLIKANFSPEQFKKLQLIELEILKIVDAFCIENNITYYLAEGTLLGAIRHNGFIPWDDDVDIIMPRDDYNKFIKLFNTQIINGCKLCNRHTIKEYHLPFSKIVILENTGFINNESFSLKEYNGVYIDIFPLDKAVEYGEEQNRRRKKIRKYRDMLLFKTGYPMKVTKEKFFTKIKSYFCSYEVLHKKIEALSTYYNDKSGCDYVANYCSSYQLKKQTFPAQAFSKAQYISFEGLMLPVPQEYDLVLGIIYGDYLTFPPLEKRKSRHSFIYITKLSGK
jgi:phosphorylcholine metabolism protein LicD